MATLLWGLRLLLENGQPESEKRFLRAHLPERQNRRGENMIFELE